MLACDPFLKSAVFGHRELTVCHLGDTGLVQEKIDLPASELGWGTKYALHFPAVGILVAISPDQDRVFGWDVSRNREVWSLTYSKLALSEGLWSCLFGEMLVASVSCQGTSLLVEPVTGHILRKENRLSRMLPGICHTTRSFEWRVTAAAEGVENCVIREQLRDWPVPWSGRVGAVVFHSDGRPRNRAKKLRCTWDFVLYDPAGTEQLALCEIAPRISGVLCACRDDTHGDFLIAYREHGPGSIKVAHLDEWKDGEPQGRDVAFGLVAKFLSPRYLVTEKEVVEVS